MKTEPSLLRRKGFEFEKVISCPACEAIDRGVEFSSGLTKCSNCALYYRNPRPNQALILHSYEDGLTFKRWQTQLDSRTPLWQKRLDLVLKYKQAGRLMDIGTGDGFFLGFTKPYFQTEATEISKKGVEYARSHGHDVHKGEFSDLINAEDKFDVITLWHVLEHVPFPKILLEEIRQHLAANGVLALAIPNELGPLLKAKYLSHSTQPFGKLAFGEEIHLTHFTPNVIKALLQKVGFEILEFGVDDVHRQQPKPIGYHLNRGLNSILKTHLDRAMYVICTPRK